MKKSTFILLAAMTLAIAFLPFVYSPRDSAQSGPRVEIAFSTFKTLVRENAVEEVLFWDDGIRGSFVKARPVGPDGRMTDRFSTRIPPQGDPSLLQLLEQAGVTYGSAGDGSTLLGKMSAWLPWIVILGFYLWWSRRLYQNMPGGMGGMGGRGGFDKFLQGGADEEETGRPDVTFDDVAGQDAAKKEVAELVEFLRDPDRFTALGAEVPHGVLLMGPPGTGKTLLARALAAEAGVPFFSVSASEFIEVFVGVGASRVRNMFREAKKRAPSIIFIDELDSIGRVRGAGLGGGHDEREQTLNQILAEMDGFSQRDAVIILAATNRPDVLDPALLRPGRFDRHVTLSLPDREARRKILAVHTRKIPLDDDVELDQLAAGTPGFSGADLKNLVNEAAMAAAREAGDTVRRLHFDAARDRVMMGPVRGLVITPEERHRLAVHEAGHVVAAYFLPNADPLYKVTVIPRGMALGATQQLPQEERYTLPEEYLRDRLAVMLGGRAAEEAVLSSVSSGADDDIRQATALARAMISRWGMSDEVGPVDVRDSEEHPFLGREIAQPRHYSEATARVVDDAVRALLIEAERRVSEIIEAHKAALDHLIAAIEERETLAREEIEAILSGCALESLDAAPLRADGAGP